MLHEVEVLEARRIAGLAENAGRVRARLLEKVPEADLGEPTPARGVHNPSHTIVLSVVLSGKPELIALREAIESLPRDIRETLWAATQVGRGEVLILDSSDQG